MKAKRITIKGDVVHDVGYRLFLIAESNYPPAAAVESIDVKDYEDTVRSIDAFRQSFMVFQLTKIAQTWEACAQ